ncbi:TonB-dependent siderophore receptor [Tenacibaculum sp.]|uniref:TonB-dependent siderophore receptor n=1 Tax=Tenacibaculum sp. TaxID=1906242 RepID=UPI003D0F8F7C
MKEIITTFFILFTVVSIAQENIIRGIVEDNNGIPLIGVTVITKGTENGTQTDVNGSFEIKRLTSKTEQALVFSYVGYKTKTVIVNQTSNNLKIVLFEGNELLSEVVVDTNRKNKFSRKESAYVAKLPLKNIENSQVYSTITNQLLVSQSTTSFEDALKNSVGISKLWTSTGRGGDGAGYYALRGFAVQPKLVNGVSGITNGFVNPNNVERIEVIKGPSATLFGSTITSYGGLINIITKKPYQGTGGNITISGGSFNFKKIALDVNTDLEDNENISLRLNAGYQSEDSFQDQGFRKSLFLAPSLSYKINDKLSLNFSYELSSNEQTNPTFLFLNRSVPLVFKNLKELNYDTSKSLTNNDVTINNPTQNYRGEVSYKITDNWSSQTIIAGGNATSKGIYTYLWNPVNPQDNTQALPLFSLLAQNTDSETNTFNIQQNFTGDFKIGEVRNRLVVGFDYLDSQSINKSSGWGMVNAVTPQGQIVSGVPINKENVDAILTNSARSNTNVNQNIIGVYASDVVNILPELSLMAGVRYDRFNYKGDKNDTSDDEKTYTKSTFSPKFGIVYQPMLNKLSVFANYQNGFSYVNPELAPSDPNNPTSDRVLVSYDLEKANQYEFGVKTNLFNNKLDATVNYYNITVSDKVIGYGPSKQQNGKVNSQGIEVEINANPVSGLNVRGGFSYNDAKVVSSPSTPASEGKRYAEAGPEIAYNFWADYKLQDGVLKNLGFGAGFNGTSEFNTMASYPQLGEFILPAYTIFNASIYYETSRYRIALKANNITDKEYFTGWSTITPQNPRTFLGTISYKF